MSGDFTAFTIDESMDTADMQGPSSVINQVAGSGGNHVSPTRSLVVLWFVVVALYWFLGYVFRGKRGGK